MIKIDGVLLTAPATATGRLLSGLVDSAQEFARLPYASVAVITLVVRGLRSDASGLLVPPSELPTIKAMTYSSNKWPWVASQARRVWGSGVDVVRVSIGRHGDPTSLQFSDRDLIDRTFGEALSNSWMADGDARPRCGEPLGWRLAAVPGGTSRSRSTTPL